MARLTLLHINIIGIVTTLLLGVILFFLLIKPKNDDIETTAGQVSSTVAAHGTEQDVTTHKNDLKKTQQAAIKTDEDWKKESAYYMPVLPFDEKDVMNTYFFQPIPGGPKTRLGFKDLPTVYGRWITSWYDAQKDSGITRVQGTEFPIDSFSTDPNAISTITDHLTFPGDGKQWPVTVECKSFDDAMAHLKKFNKIQYHGMPVISNVSLQGQSPNLLLSYQVALYIIPKAPAPPVDPRISGSRGGGGGMGGMMGGMGGMPGMMSGSMPAGMMGGKGAGAPMMSGGASAPSSGGIGAGRRGKDD